MNKKDTQIKQLRRELAQLLESGQIQSATIRVEHVVREEKTVAAYELVGIYCELLVARLGVIDSQKTCPNDLKEAVASVLYASKRLSDVAELADIVKHFSAKYGKDFVSAAIGLQPDSGVSRLLVDKLSAKTPDGPTKMRILMEIATEHNVTWEAESLAESDPKETVLLSGVSSSVSRINSASSRIPNNQPPDFQAPATVSASQNSCASDGRSPSRDFNTGKTADHYHQDPRPSGDRTDGREHRPPNPGYGDTSPWETEFVDATTAARAAAESAERASFAARAAAELSSKERMRTMHYSTESPNSSSYDNLRNEPSHRHNSSSNVQSGGVAKEENLRSSHMQEEHSKNTVDDLPDNTSWRRGHSRDNSLEKRPNDFYAKTDIEKKQQPSMDDISRSCQDDVQLKKQSSRGSSGSHTSYFSDDNNVASYIHAPSILEDNRFQSTVKDTESQNHDHDVVTAPAFDDYSSYFDKPQFDNEDAYGDEPEQGLGFSLLGSSSKTPDHLPTETNSWGFKGHKSLGQPSSSSTSQVLEKEKPSFPLFDDGPTSPPASLHESEPSAKFDDYDRGSESEEDNLRNKGIHSGRVEEKPKLTSDKSSMSEVPDDLGRYFFPSDSEDQGDDSKPQEESDAETPTGLRFGPLAGGLKTPPPHGMSLPKDKILSKSGKEHVQTEADPSGSSSSSTRKDLYPEKSSNPDKRPSYIPPDSSSSDDETEMELPKRVYIRNQDRITESRTRPSHLHSRVTHDDSKEGIPIRASSKTQERRTRRTIPDSSASYFNSVSSDDEDEKEVPRDVVRTQTKPSISISRRTKGQDRRSSLVNAKTEKVSHDQESPPKLISEAKRLAKQQVPASSSSLPKTDKTSHDQESPPKAKPLAKQQGSASTSSSLPKTKVSRYQESPPKQRPEAKSLAKQEGSASSSSSLPKIVTSPDPETPAKEKASH
ncbi:hypothetical protein EUTSA_v10027451mg, partial [Eutrema salsugineum]